MKYLLTNFHFFFVCIFFVCIFLFVFFNKKKKKGFVDHATSATKKKKSGFQTSTMGGGRVIPGKRERERSLCFD